MPLNADQKSSIYDSISHLLPETTAEFLEKENELHRALSEKNLPEAHEFFGLHTCFFEPTSSFNKLEDLNCDPVTLQDVREYILSLVTEKRSTVESTADTDPWIFASFTGIFADHHAKFETVKKPEAVPDMWELPSTAGTIFTQKISLNIQETSGVREYLWPSKISVIVTIPSLGIEESLDVDVYPAMFNDDLAQERKLNDMKESAIKKAYNYALRKVTECLSIELSARGYEDRVIILQYWFDLLRSSQIEFIGLTNLSEDAAVNLAHPNIMALHKDNIFTLDECKSLKRHERRIVTDPVYVALLKQCKICYADIYDISIRRCDLLLHYTIKMLIQTGKRSFQEAKLLPAELAPVLTSAHYQGYFTEGEVDWRNFNELKDYHCGILLKGEVAKALGRQAMSMGNIRRLTKESVDWLQAMPYLLNCLINRIFNTAEVNKATAASEMVSLFAKSFARRLFGLTFNNAYIINHTTDTPAIVSDEVNDQAMLHGDVSEFHEWIYYHYINLLQSHLVCEEALYHDFILLLQRSALTHADKLHTLLTLADQTLRQCVKRCFVDRSSNSSHYNSEDVLFTRPAKMSRRSSPADDLKPLCEGLMVLREILPAPAPAFARPHR